MGIHGDYEVLGLDLSAKMAFGALRSIVSILHQGAKEQKQDKKMPVSFYPLACEADIENGK